VKTKKHSKTIHIKVEGEQDIESVFAISVEPKATMEKSKVKAGNNGLLEYLNLDASRIEVQFQPVTCDGSSCRKPAKYQLLVANNIQNIYGELNCAGSYMYSQTPSAIKAQGQLYEVSEEHYDVSSQSYRFTV
jgi:hypothetical protein